MLCFPDEAKHSTLFFANKKLTALLFDHSSGNTYRSDKSKSGSNFQALLLRYERFSRSFVK